MQRATHNPEKQMNPARSVDKAERAPAALPADVARSRAGYFKGTGT